MILFKLSSSSCEALLSSFKIVYSHCTIAISKSNVAVFGVELGAEYLSRGISKCHFVSNLAGHLSLSDSLLLRQSLHNLSLRLHHLAATCLCLHASRILALMLSDWVFVFEIKHSVGRVYK